MLSQIKKGITNTQELILKSNQKINLCKGENVLYKLWLTHYIYNLNV